MNKDACILITGSGGFVGKNLVAELRNRGYYNLFEYDVNSSEEQLREYTKKCEFVYHLAGVNRPKETKEFMEGNYDFAAHLIELLEENQNNCPILVSSSIQAAENNPYGESKRKGEDAFFAHAKKYNSKVYVYRLANLFGKWCRPNYNSVVATFCHNIANNLPIKISDRNIEIGLCYIDDVLDSFVNALDDVVIKEGNYCKVEPLHYISLGRMADLLYEFKNMNLSRELPELKDPLIKKLHATYLSYLPEKGFSYPLKMNQDERGSFTEILRTADRGQVSVNISKPGVTKGNHWHHTKNEKFVVVSGEAVIRFRKIGSEDVIEYRVSGERIEVVDIPVGYTHNITNVGNSDLITVVWCNECFNPEKPDTYYENV